MAEEEPMEEEKKKKRRRIPKSSLGTQVIQEALNHYIYQRHIIRSELTVEELYEAWQILKEMQAHSVTIFLEWAKIMFSEEYRSMIELSRELAPPPQKPVTQPPKEVKDIQERFLSKMWDYLEPILDMTFDQIVNQLIPAMGMKKPPALKKAKIPVNITIEEEEPEIPNATKIDVE